MNHSSLSNVLVVIKNASKAMHKSVSFYSSIYKLSIVKLLKKEGFIKDYSSFKDKRGISFIKVFLRYDERDYSFINNIKMISKPGCKVYVGVNDIPVVYKGVGLVVMSTSVGVISGAEARFKYKIGGKVICYVW